MSSTRLSCARCLVTASLAVLLGAGFAAASGSAPSVVVRVGAGGRAPEPDLPASARSAGTVPDPNAGPSASISFRIVPDPSDYGPLSRLMAGRVTAVDVDWWDRALFKTDRSVGGYVRRLLGASSGSTNLFVPWAQRLPIPSLTATTEEGGGRRGGLRVWYQWPSVYSAYQDGAGKWWFSHWLERDDVRLPP